MIVKFSALLLLLLWQTPVEPPIATPEHMQYERTLTVPPGTGQACAALDAEIYPHAAPSLSDVRIFPAQNGIAQPQAREVPYAITLSESITEETQPARILNLGARGSSIVFDLEMPDRPYTEVALDLAGQDFLATATVSGMDTLSGGKQTALGVFTLFDLSSQHLSHDTMLPLAESTFHYLHIVLSATSAPGTPASAGHFTPAMVQGAQVPPSREAQILYTTVAMVSAPTKGPLDNSRKTRFDIPLPLRVPVEQVAFDLPASFTGNFSRDVRINASPNAAPGASQYASPAPSLPIETLTGTISRVHSTQAGHRIDEQQLSLPATLGSNLQGPAHVWIDVENGDDQPLPIASIRLQMRQRRLCFEAPASGVSYTLYYGDPTLPTPVYDYQRLFVPWNKPLVAHLGPEQPNPTFHPPPAEILPFTVRHPEVLWIALIAVICVLGAVALKSSRNVGIKH